MLLFDPRFRTASRVLPLILLGAFPAAFFPCTLASQGMPGGGELVYAESSTLGRLNPYAATFRNGPTDRLLSMLYEPLFRYNLNEGAWENVLATGFRNVPTTGGSETTAFEIDLRSDVTWHDGSDFSARDVEFTYNYIRRYGVDRQRKATVDDKLVSVRAGSGPLKLIVEFKGGISDPRDVLYDLIIPAARFNSDGSPIGESIDFKPVGTGPYKFEGNDAQGNPSVVINAAYHGEVGKLARIRTRAMQDATTLVDEFLRTQSTINLVVEVPGEGLKRIEASVVNKLERVPTSNVHALAMRQKPRSPFANRDVRRAVTMAIDREQILKNWFYENGYTLASPFAPGAAFYDPALQPIAHAPGSATQIIKTAGFANRTVTLAYLSDGSISSLRTQNVAETIRQALADVGLRVELKPQPSLQRYSRTIFDSNDWDMALVRWEFPPSYDVSALFHSRNIRPGGYNYMLHNDPLLDRRLNEFEAANDPGRKSNIMREVAQRLNEQAPAVFLLTEKTTYAYQFDKFRIPDGSVDPFYFFTYVSLWSLVR